jgi:16S rRNA (cytidine1402-2'-O)-methyltransferase
MVGKLYICGTPIGNLEDITLRVLKTLALVDVIYAEDTRHSIRLLNHFEISKPLHSYHEHNKNEIGPEIIRKLESGEQIALVSDAGMPGISDPGADLIKLCIEAALDFEIIPGVTAFSTALVGSGLDTNQFAFQGFLNRDKKIRREQLEAIQYDPRTLIFYESPHRLKEMVKAMAVVMGDHREVVLAKELTKRFERYFRGSLGTVMDQIQGELLKGEWVVLLAGSKEKKPQEVFFEHMTIPDHLAYYEATGMSRKDAMKAVAKDRGIKKSDVYKVLLEEAEENE